MVVLLVLALGLEGAAVLIGIAILGRLRTYDPREVQERLNDAVAADGVHEARLDEHAQEIKRLKAMIYRLDHPGKELTA